MQVSLVLSIVGEYLYFWVLQMAMETGVQAVVI